MEEKVKILTRGLTVTFEKRGISLFNNEKKLYRFRYSSVEPPYFSLIILAAGEKNLVKVRKIIKTYSVIPVIREVIVVGNKKQSLLGAISNFSFVKFIINERSTGPIATSLKKAICLLSSHSEFGIIFLANRIIFSAEKIDKFMHIVYKEKLEVAVPVEDEKRTHPIILSRDSLQKIRKIRKEQGMKYFIKNFSQEVIL